MTAPPNTVVPVSFPDNWLSTHDLDLTQLIQTLRNGETGWRREQTDFLEFRRDDVLVERLHDVFIGAGIERARDMVNSVFSGAEHHLGLVAAGQATQISQEFMAVH